MTFFMPCIHNTADPCGGGCVCGAALSKLLQDVLYPSKQLSDINHGVVRNQWTAGLPVHVIAVLVAGCREVAKAEFANFERGWHHSESDITWASPPAHGLQSRWLVVVVWRLTTLPRWFYIV